MKNLLIVMFLLLSIFSGCELDSRIMGNKLILQKGMTKDEVDKRLNQFGFVSSFFLPYSENRMITIDKSIIFSGNVADEEGHEIELPEGAVANIENCETVNGSLRIPSLGEIGKYSLPFCPTDICILIEFNNDEDKIVVNRYTIIEKYEASKCSTIKAINYLDMLLREANHEFPNEVMEYFKNEEMKSAL